MSTPLGGATGSGTHINVKNDSAVAIQRGDCLEFVFQAIPDKQNPLSSDYPIVGVQLLATLAHFAGVATHDIPAGASGTMCVQGPCMALAVTGVVTGKWLQAVAAGDHFADWSSGAKHAVALETWVSNTIPILVYLTRDIPAGS